MKVLIVDDDTNLLETLSDRLTERGWAVDVAGTGTEGIGQAHVNTYDLIILDLNLPDISGEAVCKVFEHLTSRPPILMLTAVGDIDTKVRLLDVGADDYLQKPFAIEELAARMRALTRRAQGVRSVPLAVGRLVLDKDMRVIHCDGADITLTRTETALLEYLMRHVGKVVTKGALLEHVWESTSGTFVKSLDVHIGNLRRKLGDAAHIETIHSSGYLLKSQTGVS